MSEQLEGQELSSTSTTSISFEKFCQTYKELLAVNGLSPHLLRSLHEKLENEIFDAGDYFLLTRTEEQSNNLLKAVVAKEEGIQVSDSNAVFLIDHAWTYRASDARKQLCEIPGLLMRLSQMMGYSIHGEAFYPDDEIVGIIRKEMWKYNQTYSINSSGTERKLPIWYIMDEFGSCIQHSDTPTVAVFPFFYQPKQTSYSVMVPLHDLDYADEITRDFANREKDSLLRKCKLLPWISSDFSDVPSTSPLFLDKHYENRFNYAGETLPEICEVSKIKKQRMKIFMGSGSEFLTDVTRFEMVDDVSEADVIYANQPIRDFKTMSQEKPKVMLSQFPCETILFCKDFFMDIAKRSTEDGSTPPWYPVTFDLYSQLPQFISHFKKRTSWAKDQNIWICKPWNLARSLNTTVTNDLNEIIRIRETEVPKIASKYIEDPVLLLSTEVEAHVKFDIRIYVLVSSIQPLKIHVCDSFYIRHSLKPFTLDILDDVGTHFTALRSEKDNSPITYALTGPVFVQQFEEQYPEYSWKYVTQDIHSCISQFIKSATSRPPPYGVGHYANSRAIYGFDVMLEWGLDSNTGMGMLNSS